MRGLAREKIKNILLMLLAAIILIALGGSSFYSWQLIRQKKELSEFILKHPGQTSVVVYSFNAQGEPINQHTAIYHNPDQPQVLASTVKLAVLTAYADAVVSGALNPEELIPVGEWERYYLPQTDGGAHLQGLKSLGLETDDLGFAIDPAARVSLDEIARVMIHYSGNAATDYLLERIGHEQLNRVLEAISFSNQTPVRPLLGTVLVIFNHEQGDLDFDRLESVINATAQGNYQMQDYLVDRYLNDPDWRQSQLEFMVQYESAVQALEKEILTYQAAASQLFPSGTAREYARLAAGAASGNLISAEVSEIVRGYLESVPSDNPLRLLYFDRWGAKDGVAPGVLTLAGYGVPKRGALVGETRVVVIMINQLPMEKWMTFFQYQSLYLLAADLGWGSRGFDALQNAQDGDGFLKY